MACEGKMTLAAASVYDENDYLHGCESLDNEMGFHSITELQNRLGWKRRLRSSSPTVTI